MAENTVKALSPKELKEIQAYLKSKSVDFRIHFTPQKVRRMEDGGLVIDPPQFSAQLVRVKPKIETETGNGEAKLATA